MADNQNQSIWQAINKGMAVYGEAQMAGSEALISTFSPSSPTVALELNRFLSQSYTYPLNIGQGTADAYEYPHAVKFYVNIPSPDDGKQSNISTVLNSAVSLGSIIESPSSVTSSSTTASFQAPLTPSTGTMAAKYATGRKRVAATVTMYMPDTVSMSYDASYDDTSLMDKSLYKLGQQAGSIADRFSGIFGSNDRSIGFVNTILTAATNNDYYPTEAKLQSKGVAVNPNIQLLFRAISLRQFQFEFMFSPKSQEEAQQVQSIIQLFKFHSAPEIIGSFTTQLGSATTSGASAGLAFIVPSSFNIQFLYLSPSTKQWYENNNIHKIAECVLESVAVDYAPNGWSTFTDGVPTQTRLTLQFKETSIITKSEVSAGY